jgi:hypothetical protein
VLVGNVRQPGGAHTLRVYGRDRAKVPVLAEETVEGATGVKNGEVITA